MRLASWSIRLTAIVVIAFTTRQVLQPVRPIWTLPPEEMLIGLNQDGNLLLTCGLIAGTNSTYRFNVYDCAQGTCICQRVINLNRVFVIDFEVWPDKGLPRVVTVGQKRTLINLSTGELEELRTNDLYPRCVRLSSRFCCYEPMLCSWRLTQLDLIDSTTQKRITCFDLKTIDSREMVPSNIRLNGNDSLAAVSYNSKFDEPLDQHSAILLYDMIGGRTLAINPSQKPGLTTAANWIEGRLYVSRQATDHIKGKVVEHLSYAVDQLGQLSDERIEFLDHQKFQSSQTGQMEEREQFYFSGPWALQRTKVSSIHPPASTGSSWLNQWLDWFRQSEHTTHRVINLSTRALLCELCTDLDPILLTNDARYLIGRKGEERLPPPFDSWTSRKGGMVCYRVDKSAQDLDRFKRLLYLAGTFLTLVMWVYFEFKKQRARYQLTPIQVASDQSASGRSRT